MLAIEGIVVGALLAADTMLVLGDAVADARVRVVDEERDPPVLAFLNFGFDVASVIRLERVGAAVAFAALDAEDAKSAAASLKAFLTFDVPMESAGRAESRTPRAPLDVTAVGSALSEPEWSILLAEAATSASRSRRPGASCGDV